MTTTKTATGAVVDFIQTRADRRFPRRRPRRSAKRCIIDGLGVMLAGSTQDAGRILHEHVQGSDPRTAATVFGPRPFKTGAASAALVNGTAGHALDWDDTQLATSADRIFGLLTHPTHAAARRGARGRRAAAHQRRAVPRGVPHGLRGRVQDRRSDPPESLQEGLPLVGHDRHVRRGRGGGEAARPRRRARRRTRSRSPRARRPASA